jgi:hypothetical protein
MLQVLILQAWRLVVELAAPFAGGDANGVVVAMSIWRLCCAGLPLALPAARYQRDLVGVLAMPASRHA